MLNCKERGQHLHPPKNPINLVNREGKKDDSASQSKYKANQLTELIFDLVSPLIPTLFLRCKLGSIWRIRRNSICRFIWHISSIYNIFLRKRNSFSQEKETCWCPFPSNTLAFCQINVIQGWTFQSGSQQRIRWQQAHFIGFVFN